MKKAKAKAQLCKVQRISFKTKRGRMVTFTGKTGGSEICGKHKPSAAQRATRRVFAKIAASCNKIRSEKGRGMCFTQRLKYDSQAGIYKRG